MAVLTGLLNSVAEPTGLWAIIIKSFESGVGSYILAVLLLTLIIRIVWAPLDTINKKMNAKMMRDQAKIAPQMEKLEKQYAKDPQLLNRKKQELYKKAGVGVGGGCLFMLVFLALNLTIFGSMFTTMNSFSSYKVNEQYEELKYSYVNIINATVSLENKDDFIANYNDYSIKIENDKVYVLKGEEVKKEINYNIDFTINKGTDAEVASETEIENIFYRYIVNDEDSDVEFLGNYKYNEVTLTTAITSVAQKYVNNLYEESKKEYSFLWVSNIWEADSPFKSSVLSFESYKNVVGKGNVSEHEEIVYNAFMTQISENYNRTNGYFILAIISIGISYLSLYLSNGKQNKKNPQQGQSNKFMMIIFPLIMGIFAIFYNSVFAFYLVVSQAINVGLVPLENLIIKKWEAHDARREELKNVVEYSRKK